MEIVVRVYLGHGLKYIYSKAGCGVEDADALNGRLEEQGFKMTEEPDWEEFHRWLQTQKGYEKKEKKK